MRCGTTLLEVIMRLVAGFQVFIIGFPEVVYPLCWIHSGWIPTRQQTHLEIDWRCQVSRVFLSPSEFPITRFLLLKDICSGSKSCIMFCWCSLSSGRVSSIIRCFAMMPSQFRWGGILVRELVRIHWLAKVTISTRFACGTSPSSSGRFAVILGEGIVLGSSVC